MKANTPWVTWVGAKTKKQLDEFFFPQNFFQRFDPEASPYGINTIIKLIYFFED
jgi:hypothetical protein